MFVPLYIPQLVGQDEGLTLREIFAIHRFPTKKKIDQVHINYIVGLRKTGKIITGGAFTDKVIWTGFEIYNCKTKEEVIKITEEDPMVLSKVFSYEIHPWVTLKGTVKFE